MELIKAFLEAVATEGGTIVVLLFLFLITFNSYTHGFDPARDSFSMILGALLGILKGETGRTALRNENEKLKLQINDLLSTANSSTEKIKETTEITTTHPTTVVSVKKGK